MGGRGAGDRQRGDGGAGHEADTDESAHQRRCGADSWPAPYCPAMRAMRWPVAGAGRPPWRAAGRAGLGAGLGGTGDAHAELVDDRPGQGAVLDRSPRWSRLTFNEDVRQVPDGVRVFDAEGDELATTATTRDEDLLVTIEDEVAAGTVVVAWRVVSTDGHPISGSLTFSVGAPTPGTSTFEPVGAPRSVSVALSLSRWPAYVGLLLAVGPRLVPGPSCCPPELDRGAAVLRRTADDWPAWAAAVSAAAWVVGLLLDALYVRGTGFGTLLRGTATFGVPAAAGAGRDGRDRCGARRSRCSPEAWLPRWPRCVALVPGGPGRVTRSRWRTRASTCWSTASTWWPPRPGSAVSSAWSCCCGAPRAARTWRSRPCSASRPSRPRCSRCSSLAGSVLAWQLVGSWRGLVGSGVRPGAPRQGRPRRGGRRASRRTTGAGSCPRRRRRAAHPGPDGQRRGVAARRRRARHRVPRPAEPAGRRRQRAVARVRAPVTGQADLGGLRATVTLDPAARRAATRSPSRSTTAPGAPAELFNPPRLRVLGDDADVGDVALEPISLGCLPGTVLLPDRTAPGASRSPCASTSSPTPSPPWRSRSADAISRSRPSACARSARATSSRPSRTYRLAPGLAGEDSSQASILSSSCLAAERVREEGLQRRGRLLGAEAVPDVVGHLEVLVDVRREHVLLAEAHERRADRAVRLVRARSPGRSPAPTPRPWPRRWDATPARRRRAPGRRWCCRA